MPSNHRYRTGGLVVAATHGSDHMRRIGALGFRAAMSLYGDSDAARRLRASDIRRRKALTDAEWRRLMESRAASFSLPIEKLLGKHARKEEPVLSVHG